MNKYDMMRKVQRGGDGGNGARNGVKGGYVRILCGVKVHSVEMRGILFCEMP